MPTRPGDPEGSPARPSGGWWGGVWRRLAQAVPTDAAANEGPYSREAVQAMIERGEDCEPVAQQLAAARKALDRAFFELMACAIEHKEMSSAAGESDAERVHRISRALAKLA